MNDNRVANDFAIIAKRAAEIRKEMQDALARAPAISCSTCNDAGWVYGAILVECPECRNPERKSRP